MSCARSPSFPFIGLASKPSEPVGTRNALIPFGPSPPVRAKTIAVAAQLPSVMKTFEPVSTQPSPSPSDTLSARVASAAASEPQPGSVSA